MPFSPSSATARLVVLHSADPDALFGDLVAERRAGPHRHLAGALRPTRLSRYFAPAASNPWPAAAGFRSDAQSVHGSRTIMLADLTTLFDAVPAGADHEAYERAIQRDNVLGKKTASTRFWAWKKLRELYALEPGLPVLGLLRTYWD